MDNNLTQILDGVTLPATLSLQNTAKQTAASLPQLQLFAPNVFPFLHSLLEDRQNLLNKGTMTKDSDMPVVVEAALVAH